MHTNCNPIHTIRTQNHQNKKERKLRRNNVGLADKSCACATRCSIRWCFQQCCRGGCTAASFAHRSTVLSASWREAACRPWNGAAKGNACKPRNPAQHRRRCGCYSKRRKPASKCTSPEHGEVASIGIELESWRRVWGSRDKSCNRRSWWHRRRRNRSKPRSAAQAAARSASEQETARA